MLILCIGLGVMSAVVVEGYFGQILGVIIGVFGGFFISDYMCHRYDTMIFVLKNLTDTEKLELVTRIQALVHIFN